jgi:uncharacterized protein
MMISRSIEPKLKSWLFKEKVVILFGARQVGKTTLVKKLMQEYARFTPLYLDCDQADTAAALSDADNSTKIHLLLGNNKLVIFDEAQRVSNIGLKLKIAADNFPQTQLIITGSSSFELSDRIIEPLTGRSMEFILHPLALPEMSLSSVLEANRQLESLLIYGSYPGIYQAVSSAEKKDLIQTIAHQYLYKDILKFQSMKGADIVLRLLQALALQIGSEVSYTELANLLGISKETVASYIEILEKAFVLFRLLPFARNRRKELGKLRKIYFYDVGVRNALIDNFNPPKLRSDTGALWENFVVAEIVKQKQIHPYDGRFHFWRTYDQQEVDLVEDTGGQISAFEIKWGKTKKQPPKAWREGYPEASWNTITPKNYFDLLFPKSSA